MRESVSHLLKGIDRLAADLFDAVYKYISVIIADMFTFVMILTFCEIGRHLTYVYHYRRPLICIKSLHASVVMCMLMCSAPPYG